MSQDGMPRYGVTMRRGFVGILDTKKNLFAPFHETGPWRAIDRATATARRLNAGEETTTGYTWEKS